MTRFLRGEGTEEGKTKGTQTKGKQITEGGIEGGNTVKCKCRETKKGNFGNEKKGRDGKMWETRTEKERRGGGSVWAGEKCLTFALFSSKKKHVFFFKPNPAPNAAECRPVPKLPQPIAE